LEKEKNGKVGTCYNINFLHVRNWGGVIGNSFLFWGGEEGYRGDQVAFYRGGTNKALILEVGTLVKGNKDWQEKGGGGLEKRKKTEGKYKT